ncbi:L-threonylcarbamoyladenylate synthase [Thalassoglobus polymorphus]|uniref:Threonylcarbamoyl-AMP synthase n=1 Tax=Thalassoglobus polymorphus TaxID=2527994 RepID=A0A517QQ05_9PLAN|nr:L-threonylcarbamoyladenylate synthase [Thalassoglobus polymorphus]QDT33716.1 Threonylcarbamoyl-AMP synthase [Thalassoglobus polymorphus]
MIQDGKLVAFATETVYGLGANALNPVAVAKIFEAKERPHFDPLIVHLCDQSQLEEFVESVSETAQALVDHFWPGPLTLVLPKRDLIPDLVTSGLPNVAIRIPERDSARELIQKAGVPIAAPSANRFGSVSPTTAEHVLDGLEGRIDAVLDDGACDIGVESTVLACPADGTATLLRPGGLSLEEIEKVIGKVLQLDPNQNRDDSPQAGPGMLSRHYAPSKPIQIVSSLQEIRDCNGKGALMMGSHETNQFEVVENLSPSGSLVEAAANFFAALRRLERTNIDSIVAMPFPNEGLGRALNDRLKRAAAE